MFSWQNSAREQPQRRKPVEIRRATLYVRQKSILSNTRRCMERTSASKPQARGTRQPAESRSEGGARRAKVIQRDAKAGEPVIGKARFEAVMQAAAQSGLLTRKSA